MLLSLVDELRFGAVYPELEGARVMISGVCSRFGVDISRGFADHRARLLLQTIETSAEMDEVATILAQTAGELKIYDRNADEADGAISFAQGAAQRAFGGLDVVVNLIQLTHGDLSAVSSLEDVEDLVSEKLLGPTLMSRVMANRMRLTWTDGLILNVIGAPGVQNAREAALASVIEATLAAITRKEAEAWAQEGIRLNAIMGGGASSVIAGVREPDCDRASEPDIAAVALYLASENGAALSGQVFDASKVLK